ncbi:PaaX family transcriptional regulator C-terminal domain-containing protein [Aeromicrobium sp. Leaf350]|uniref:PaaX family transcriptional regulator C-terminal domain-containing protein n=1 Tax=Aeromicrobium sp. Leaf350 TaxID=2876565 RepID=UPI001E4B6578|nr:PaaX family transcriptional regulator C-terminal domain-containing protein [Aeromicrobium sp. Leaf350]
MSVPDPRAADPRPLTARSVALSLLLGAHPARLSPAQLTRAGEHFGVPAATLRVALTRAIASGDLERADGDYVLGERLVERQHRQDEGVLDAETTWDGDWEMAVVVVAGRTGPERAALRQTLVRARLAELREGTWMRPANLRRSSPVGDELVVRTFHARPDGPADELAAELWDLASLAREGHALLSTLEGTHEPAARLRAASDVVRHLADDPLLPRELLPADWPGPRLRAAYADYRAELRDLAIA